MVKRTVKRSKLPLGGAALVFLIPAAACSPADRQFGTGGAGGAGSTTASAVSSSASASSSTSASSGATSSSSTGAGGSGGGGCSADADNDGFVSIACGGNDCADNDALVYPGQLKWSTTPSKGTMSFDYNCDGKEEIQYTSLLKCNMLPCDTNSKSWASLSPPPCGVTADYGACQLSGFNCVPVVVGMRVQGCR